MKFWIVFVLLMIVSMAYAEDSEKKDGTDENGTVMLVQRKVKNGGATYRVSTEDGTILADSARVKPGTVLYVDVDVKRDDEGVFMLDAAYLAVNAYHTPKYYINGRMTEIEKGKRYKFTMSEWNADVSLSIFPLYTIKVYVEGNGSVTIKNTVRDTYKGENYYVSANVVFLVDADEGYYLSSVNMRNWNKKPYSTSINQANEITEFSYDGQGHAYEVDAVFKKIDTSLSEDLGEHCKTSGLPATAESADRVKFTVHCDEGYFLSKVYQECGDKNDKSCYKDISADKNGIYSMTKGNSASVVKGKLQYKVTFEDEGESYVDYYTSNEGFYDSGINYTIKAKHLSSEVIKSISYSYYDGADSVKGELKLLSCSANKDCTSGTFKMPAAPVVFKVTRGLVNYGVGNELDGICVAKGLPDSANAGDKVKFNVVCEAGYALAELPVFGEEGSSDLSSVDSAGGEYSFTMPASNVVLSGGQLKYAVILEDTSSSFVVFPDADMDGDSVYADYALPGDAVRIYVGEVVGSDIGEVMFSYKNGDENQEMKLKLLSCDDDGCWSEIFLMPSVPVSVSVERKKREYAVAKNNDEHCSVEGLSAKLFYGGAAEFTVTCDEGFEAAVSLVCEDGKTCPVLSEKDGVYGFVQSLETVLISVESSEIPAKDPVKDPADDPEDDDSGNGDSETTVVKNHLQNALRISVVDRSVMISGLKPGSSVAVFDMQGRVIRNVTADRNAMLLDLPRPGRYLLKSGTAHKVINVR